MNRLPALLVAGVVAGVDLLTKGLAFSWLPDRGTRWVFPEWFGFTRAMNAGITGGALGGLGPVVLTAITGAAALGVAGYILFSRGQGRAVLYGPALVLGGAAGNLYDRIRLGKVRDFIDVRPGLKWPSWLHHWPTFNVADMAIVSGVMLLLLCTFLSSRKKDDRGAVTAGTR